MPLELVRDFAVRVYNKENIVFEKIIHNNVQRLSVIPLPENIYGDKVVLEIFNTYGYENARVFEIRIY